MKRSPEAPWFDTLDRQIRLRHSSVVVFTACCFDATVRRTKAFPDVRSTIKIHILVPCTVRVILLHTLCVYAVLAYMYVFPTCKT
jgi:hypothetical protein